MNKISFPIIAAIAGLAVGVTFEHFRVSLGLTPAFVAPVAENTDNRLAAIESAPERPQAIIIGDSIAASTWEDRACGMSVANFAVKGAATANWLRSAAKLSATLHPRLVIIAVGTNDALVDSRQPLDQWERDYRKLIAAFAGAHIILVTPPETERGASVINRARLATIRATIGKMPSKDITVAPSIAFSKTIDGVHPDAHGRRQWLANLDHACPSHATV